MQYEMKPTVAIVGRPNVGKSTLFNRLTGQPKSIVSEISGTTRDRITAEIIWGDLNCVLIDTGGLDEQPQSNLWQQIRNQIDLAIDEADVILMLTDSNVGITPADKDVADVLRKSEKQILLVANKADNQIREAGSSEFFKLGLGSPIPISAYHNIGIDDLMVNVISHFQDKTTNQTIDADLNLAIVGRTNVGKSMLVNTIIGQNRAIVTDIPGTTRDSLDTLIEYNNHSILLVDTAGLRRRGKVELGIERYSTIRTIRALDRADVAVLLMDASELATNQDTHITSYILDSFKGIVLGINKWDLATKIGLDKKSAIQKVTNKFKFASYAPACFISAKNKTGIPALIDAVHSANEQWSRELPRYGLKRTVMNAISEHPPASSGYHSLKIYGVTQSQSKPPTFDFYVNRSDMVHFSYKRYLENTIREAYGFKGSPLKLRFKGRGESWDTG